MNRETRDKLLLLLCAGAILSMVAFNSRGRLGPPRVRFRVAVAAGEGVQAVSVALQYEGETRTVALSPVPLRGGGQRWEGEWIPSGPVLILPIHLAVGYEAGGTTVAVGRWLEVLHTGRNTLDWTLEPGPDSTAVRSSRSAAIAVTELREAGHLLLKGVVALAVLCLAFAMAGRMPGTAVQTSLPRDRAPAGGALLDLLFWLLLAIAWTWPAALAQERWVVGRNSDVLTTTWVISAAPRLLSALEDSATSWPLLAAYRHLDSFLLLPCSAMFKGVGPARLHGWLQIVGIALSAWAAQGFARSVGARRPWDRMAGLIFAFSGVAANVLLEGHLYHVMNPWLPLFAWCWQAALTRRKSLLGLCAGVFFTMILLTSGYLGVAAAIVGAGFLIGHVVQRRRWPWRAVAGLGLVAVPVCLAYLGLYGVAGDLERDLSSGTMAEIASASLSSLIGATPEVDRTRHSLAVELSPVCVALLVVAPVVLSRRKGYRTLLWLSVAVIGFSMGPVLSPGTGLPGLPSPLALFRLVPALDTFLRFPLRYVWAANLCAGAVAALVVSRVSIRRRGWAWLFLALALLHPFLALQLPARQTARAWEQPVGYPHGGDPVLDIFPAQHPPCDFDSAWFTGLAAVYQIDHGQTISENCIATSDRDSPRAIIGHWITRRLLAGDSDAVAHALADLGFGSVVLHADLFPQPERAGMETALACLGTAGTVSTNNGLRTVTWALSSDGKRATRSRAVERFKDLCAEWDRDPETAQVEVLRVSDNRTQDRFNGSAALLVTILYALTAWGGYRYLRKKAWV